MRLHLDNLDELRVFAQVVESGSIVAAAQALGLHPSTASRRLSTLEARIGRPLLHRTTRHQSLSETGRTLLAQVHKILKETEVAELLLETDHVGLTGQVKIGVVSVLADDILAAIRPITRAHPKLQLQVRVNDRIDNPITAGLDVVLRGGRLPDSTLIARKLMDFEVVLAASDEYLDRFGQPETPDELEQHLALWTPGEQRSAWTLLDHTGASHVIAARAQVEVDGGIPMVDAMRHGLGIGTTSPRMIRRFPRLRRVLPGYRVGKFPLFAIYPSSGQRSAKLQAVVDALHESLERDTTQASPDRVVQRTLTSRKESDPH